MRIVVVGTTVEAVNMIELLHERDHEIIVIEQEVGRIENIEETLDVSFLHGDGTQPDVLKDTDPEGSDVLIALTNQDQTNILACLAGRSLGFPRVIPRIDSPDFEDLSRELGLDEMVLPDRTVGRYLADLVEGLDVLELRTVIRGEARFFTFQAESREGRVDELELPEKAAVVCVYRDGDFELSRPDLEIEANDEVVILTHRRHLSDLRERWTPETEN